MIYLEQVITHHDPKNLEAVLLKQGWAVEVRAGCQDDFFHNSHHSMLEVEVRLTEAYPWFLEAYL